MNSPLVLFSLVRPGAFVIGMPGTPPPDLNTLTVQLVFRRSSQWGAYTSAEYAPTPDLCVRPPWPSVRLTPAVFAPPCYDPGSPPSLGGDGGKWESPGVGPRSILQTLLSPAPAARFSFLCPFVHAGSWPALSLSRVNQSKRPRSRTAKRPGARHTRGTAWRRAEALLRGSPCDEP